MIRKKWSHKIVSDEGFSIVILNKDTLQYKEGDKKLTLNSELLAREGGFVIYKDAITNWDSPYHDIRISQPERDQILEKIKMLLSAENINVQII
ncbi:Imm74 family immunity protein [Spirochaeta thermophila]|uniref:Imm74 family immunity protein n=1 Tax=Winmispira thermophila TaxID=154 RepID=UPI0005A1D52C|nr:Imm74 family immunity protein [Spirochaeta thermophila]